MSVEHEIKIPVDELATVRERLGRLVGRPVHPEELEENWVLDDHDAALAAAGKLLRVRRWGGRAWVTFKGPAAFAGGVKSRDEIELEVAESASLIELLGRIGFEVLRRYQKRREVWRALDSEIALDVTPMGCYVEIEGDPASITAAATTLGLDPGRAVSASYMGLWEQYRASHPGAPVDMLFP